MELMFGCRLDSRWTGAGGCAYLEVEIALARACVLACRAVRVVYSVGRVFVREVESVSVGGMSHVLGCLTGGFGRLVRHSIQKSTASQKKV